MRGVVLASEKLGWEEASKKCQGLGGFLVSIAREVAYQANVKPGDRIHFATDMGWIMGPWTVVGGGACGATIVYAEGAPDFEKLAASAPIASSSPGTSR